MRGNSCSSGSRENNFARHINEFVGETVTIFTTSGGASGCGFTGVILSVNCDFVRLVTEQGRAPSNPLAENICGEFENNNGRGCQGMGRGNNNGHNRHVTGSVCDIPIDRIAAFCHNAV